MGGGGDELIHIRIQQRNGRKTLTTVQGIHEKYDKKKIVKWCKKVSRRKLELESQNGNGKVEKHRVGMGIFTTLDLEWDI